MLWKLWAGLFSITIRGCTSPENICRCFCAGGQFQKEILHSFYSYIHVPLQVKQIFNWDECCCVIYSDKHENKMGVVLLAWEKPCHQIHCFRPNYKSVRGNAEGSDIFELVTQSLTKSHWEDEREGAGLSALCVAGTSRRTRSGAPGYCWVWARLPGKLRQPLALGSGRSSICPDDLEDKQRACPIFRWNQSGWGWFFFFCLLVWVSFCWLFPPSPNNQDSQRLPTYMYIQGPTEIGKWMQPALTPWDKPGLGIRARLRMTLFFRLTLTLLSSAEIMQATDTSEKEVILKKRC